jgi:hypothetical protein
MSNFVNQSLQDLQQQVPIISDKILVDLVNGIQVNDDLIRFRQNRGFIGRLFDGITGSERDRQILIDLNCNVGMKSLHQWVLALADNLRISNIALEITQTKLLETRNALRNHRQEIDILKQITEHLQIQLNDHEQRIHNLEQRVYRIETIQKIDAIIAAWQSGRTYQGFHWAVQIAFVIREIVDFALFDYERMTSDRQLRPQIIDKLITASHQIPDNCFSLITLLNLAHQETASDLLELAQALLEVRSLPPSRLAEIPYLFTLGTTLELAALPEEARPKDPAKTAFELCRRDYDLILPATDKNEFIERLVHETACDRLVFRNSLGK